MLAKRFTFILGVLFLSGCATSYHPAQPQPGERQWQPTVTKALPATAPKAKDGSLLQNARLLNMFQDRRAYGVGDILTVMLDEETQSSKKADTDIGKSSDTSGTYSAVFPNTNESGSFGFGSNRSFNGSSSASQQNTLTGAITVTIAEVLDTGALRINGEKWIKLNQGDEYIRLTGLIRVEDVDRANRISSQRIADARITYAGRGALAEANQQGWLSRFFNSGWFPF
ncbi:flagellar basal body L-ring protein FlgH [Thalassomonas actiniarum]|uniref:Flagellar L-ring protein n=1 Tax=Thalassomonas actiniarum TaxID=485447 RepID=A0AAE9YS63_9GAMM|nr:flagellar basal body L-ring protein FlgH [Thalassomonas actiniarum]WDD99318.1 flagellar basal body L-ring protein FlgH [Thalassomonas actiniarum]